MENLFNEKYQLSKILEQALQFEEEKKSKLIFVNFPVKERMLIDDYYFLNLLGTGGMGIVYQAQDLKKQRLVAVKFFLKGLRDEETSQKRFLREIEISMSLDHPNIVRAYKTGTFNQCPFLVMEAIQGYQLLKYLQKKPASIQEKLNLVVQIADALDYAHRKNIVHRDVKPSNIIVRPDGVPKLLDFGIARAIKMNDWSITKSNEVVGTLHYMSPEQIKGSQSEIDAQTDVYSLGAVMYHMLTEVVPVRGNNIADKIQNIQKSSVIPPRQINSLIPKEVSKICLKALKKNKRHRYCSAKEFGDAIREYMESRSEDTVWYKEIVNEEFLFKCRETFNTGYRYCKNVWNRL